MAKQKNIAADRFPETWELRDLGMRRLSQAPLVLNTKRTVKDKRQEKQRRKSLWRPK